MVYSTEIGSVGTIYGQTFMKIGTCIQAIFKFCLRNLKVCSVALRPCNEFGLHNMYSKLRVDWFRYLSSLMVNTADHLCGLVVFLTTDPGVLGSIPGHYKKK
jgi:hypothetical protein